MLVLFFCSRVASVAATVYEGFGDRLPLLTQVVLRLGPAVCVVSGVAVAAGMILAEMYSRRRWIQYCIIAGGVALVVVMYIGMFTPGFGMGPVSNSDVHASNAAAQR